MTKQTTARNAPKFVVRLRDEAQRAAIEAMADQQASSMNAVIIQAIDEKLDRGQSMDLVLQVAKQALAPPFGIHSDAACSVIRERYRQSNEEGHTNRSDDEYPDGVLTQAAIAYASPLSAILPKDQVPQIWPWPKEAWKPKDRRTNLVRAAALLIAEIERLDREEVIPCA